MSIEQLAQLFRGKAVSVNFGDSRVDCHVLQVKQSYGCDRLFVRPIAGSGATWVETSSVRIQEEKQNG